MPPAKRHTTWTQPFSERAALPGTSPLAAHIYRLIASKQTNLCLSADVTTTSELLDVAEECGDSICILKTHCDIVSDFGARTVKGLTEIATRKRFLIFEDRKFGDIGNTVQAQYAAGTHRIASWAAITNAHIFPGPAVITALKAAAASAITASSTTVATEIYGGSGPRQSLPIRERAQTTQGVDSSEDEPEASESAEDEEESSEEDTVAHPEPSGAQRKHSEVSISTTISSSKEYVSPPGGSAAASPRPTLSIDPTDRPPLARGLLLLAQMSSADNLFTPAYTSKCVELARLHKDFVMGFIGQEALNKEPGDNFLVMTPGVSIPAPSADKAQAAQGSSTKLQQQTGSSSSASRKQSANPSSSRGDALGQQYNDPRSVILDKGVDVIIVGRGILNADDREEEAEKYRLEGWRALNERWGRRR